MRVSFFIFYTVLFLLTFCGGDGVKESFIYVSLVFILFAVFLQWLKIKVIQIIGKVLFSISLLMNVSNGVGNLLYWVFPQQAEQYPVMNFISWRGVVGYFVAVVFVIWFFRLFRKEKPNIYYVVLALVSTFALWLGFSFANQMPYG